MNSLLGFILFALIIRFENVQGMENLLGTPIQNCLNCLCHTRTGCWSRHNCARYSISKYYWKTAGSYTVGSCETSDEAYRSCMANENCILNTIKSYTEVFGEVDCNCDNVFDCKDRLAVHLFGKRCHNPKFGSIYANRFNQCAEQVGVSGMLAAEGSCNVTYIDVRAGGDVQ